MHRAQIRPPFVSAGTPAGSWGLRPYPHQWTSSTSSAPASLAGSPARKVHAQGGCPRRVAGLQALAAFASLACASVVLSCHSGDRGRGALALPGSASVVRLCVRRTGPPGNNPAQCNCKKQQPRSLRALRICKEPHGRLSRKKVLPRARCKWGKKVWICCCVGAVLSPFWGLAFPSAGMRILSVCSGKPQGAERFATPVFCVFQGPSRAFNGSRARPE